MELVHRGYCIGVDAIWVVVRAEATGKAIFGVICNFDEASCT